MNKRERKELMDALATNYLCEKRNNHVWQRENSVGYSIAFGKLQGACMALNLEFEENEKGVFVLTRNRRNVITTISK